MKKIYKAVSVSVCLVISLLTGCSGPKTDPWMDRITKIGVSTNDDFQNFKDDGGLNVHGAWRGYSVQSISTEFTEGKLSFFQVTLKKNYSDSNGVDPTINNLKESFSNECGSEWTAVGEGGYRNSDSHPINCEVTANASDFTGGLVMIKPEAQ